VRTAIVSATPDDSPRNAQHSAALCERPGLVIRDSQSFSFMEIQMESDGPIHCNV